MELTTQTDTKKLETELENKNAELSNAQSQLEKLQQQISVRNWLKKRNIVRHYFNNSS